MSRATAGRSPISMALRLAFAVAVFGGRAVAGEDVTLSPSETWSCAFGGEAADYHFVVKGADRPNLHAGWAFSMGRRTVASGEVEVVALAGGLPTASVHLDLPPVKEGVILPALLTVSLSGGVGGKAVAIVEKPLWIFPRDPFHDRSRWLKGRKLTLFDPAETTAAAFERLHIPFEPARDVDAVAALAEGTLIVGEGASFAEQRGLADAISGLAARGIPVLCLAPKDGTLAIPGADEARTISLRRADVISAIDPRLDADAWPGEGELVASGLVLKAEADRAVGEVTPGRSGWPWLEVGYPGRKGGLVVCGFGLLSHWDAGPCPRFLFAQMLGITAGVEDVPPKPDPIPLPDDE